MVPAFPMKMMAAINIAMAAILDHYILDRWRRCYPSNVMKIPQVLDTEWQHQTSKFERVWCLFSIFYEFLKMGNM